MITKEEAEKIINSYLAKQEEENLRFKIHENETLEEEKFWVFFYNSKEFVETGDYSYVLSGNSPLVVSKSNGEIIITGTARPLEFYLDQIRNYNEIIYKW